MALNPLDRLVRDVDNLKKQVAGRSQINHSSLENTAIPVYDGDGTERLRIGAQDDGTHAVVYVQGPPPPRPTAPIVSVDGPVVRVRWDGQLMGGHIPEDFARIDVHFALASDDIEDPSAVRANLATAAGSEATLMATQTGTYRVGLVAMSQSRARSEMSETIEVEVQVVDLATAIETAAQSANGKNTVTYSERSPEPTDEGAEGDTWWVNEVRPRDPEDPASGVVIAIIEQWQHAGDVWVQVEMAHEVIASVDLGRATVGFLHGERIEAGTIDTDQLVFGAATGEVLSADALNFKTARGLDIVSSSFRAGDAVEITEDFGIRQFGPDGALNVSLPSNGSEAQFRGDLSARTLTATGRMAIQGPGAVASGGVLELESGVVPPISPPNVNMTWGRTRFPALADEESASGLAWGDGHWWRGVQTTYNGPDATARIEKITTDGVLVSSFPVEFRSTIYGITILDDIIYVLGWPRGFGGGDRYVIGYNYDGVEQTRWVYPNYGTGTWKPGIGTWGSNILIGQSWANGDFTYRIYRPHDGYRISQRDTGRKVYSDIVNLDIRQFDHEDRGSGSSRLIVACKRSGEEGRQFISYSNTTTIQHYPDEAWYAADMAPIMGAAWDGERFYSLSQNGDLATYESPAGGRFAGDNEDDWWLASVWSDEAGNQLTPAGPAQRFRYLHRARIRHSVSDVPDGVGRIRFYLAKTEGVPQRTDLRWVSHIEATVTTSWTGTIGDDWQTGANPPASNTFATDAPGEIRSAIGGFRVDGAGAGEWGSFNFHGDGSVTGKGTVVTGRVQHTRIEAGGNEEDVTVTFPVGRFTSPPTVQVTNSHGRHTAVASRMGTTKDSFRLRVWNFTNGYSGTSTTEWAAFEEA